MFERIAQKCHILIYNSRLTQFHELLVFFEIKSKSQLRKVILLFWGNAITFLRPLTVLIPNCIYRCDIIHPLVRYHGRSRRSPAPPSGPLGGPTGPLVGPTGPLVGPSRPLVGPSGPLGGPSGPLGGSSGPLGGPAGPLGRLSIRPAEHSSRVRHSSPDCNHPIYMGLHAFRRAHTFEREGGRGGIYYIP